MRYLPSINSPADLRALPGDTLPAVATELRQFICETITQQGGHLGATLELVFGSRLFYSDAARRSLVKGPSDFTGGADTPKRIGATTRRSNICQCSVCPIASASHWASPPPSASALSIATLPAHIVARFST